MPYIYKITNKKNGKIYIGKTMFTVPERWSEHCRDYKKERCENRPLYKAIQKYGVDGFTVEEVEECSSDVLSEREKHWIEYYGSFKNGYNATIGGDGSQYIDYDVVIQTYLQTGNQNKTAEIIGICPESVKNILKIKNVDSIPMTKVNQKAFGSVINMFSLSGDFVKSFPSARDAARFILSDTDNTSNFGAAAHILDVCKGKRKTAYKYKWSYA